MVDREKYRASLVEIMKMISEDAPDSMPEDDGFRSFFYRFPMPGDTISSCLLYLEGSPGKPEAERRIRLSGQFPHDDRVMSVYLFSGTRQQVLDYLGSPEIVDEVLEETIQLDEAIGKHD